MLSIIGFLIILAPLVIVHEFGHFFFARLFGVKAEAFSVGFGPRIWARYFGETEFRLSAIPLGGYVKLLGEDAESTLTEEEKKRALHHQSRGKRFWIFFGGPLFNFLFAILIYMVILVIGEPQVASVVGRVIDKSPAALAGFQSGDKIIEAQGKPIRFFSELMNVVSEAPDQPVQFKVIHPESTQPVLMTVMTSSEPGYSIYGEPRKVGHIEGIFASPRATRVGISNPASLAAKAGIVTLDEVTAFNGVEVKTWEHLEDLYLKAAFGNVTLKLKRADASLYDVKLSKPKPSTGLSTDFGLHSSELFVDRVVKDSPAEGSGLKKGDRIVRVGETELKSFFGMKDAIQLSGEEEKKVELAFEREGKISTTSLIPNSTTERDPTMKKTKNFTIGVMPMLALAPPEMLVHRILNPISLFIEGTERMLILSWRNLVSIGKMFTGDVSVGTLGGPILIGKIAGDSLSRGLISFLSTMAILSVGLGILNVLPVPVLDGGHILLLGVEAVRRKRLSMRQMEIFQQVGLSLILLLMVVVMKNDVLRLPFSIKSLS